MPNRADFAALARSQHPGMGCWRKGKGNDGGMAKPLVFANELRLSLLAAVAGVLVGVVSAAFLTAIDLRFAA